MCLIPDHSIASVVFIVRLVTGTQTSRSRGEARRVEVENKRKHVSITTVIDTKKINTKHNIECLVIYSRENL